MLIPTISFPGNCDEALAFYKNALGAEVREVAYFRDAPPDSGLDASLPANFVMHSEVLIFDTLITMTDGGTAPITGDYFSLMLSLSSVEEVSSAFLALADGGQVINDLAPQFWSSLCGDVQDRFGIHWHICAAE